MSVTRARDVERIAYQRSQRSLDLLRAHYADMKRSYAAAKPTRFTPRLEGISSDGSDADYHYYTQSDFYYMIESARGVDRDDMCVSQGVTRFCSNVVQDGFRLKATTGSDAVDRELEDRWQEQTDPSRPERMDRAGNLTWTELQHLALRHMIVDGDFSFLPTTSGQLEAIEAHRIRSPWGAFSRRLARGRSMIHGVEFYARSRRRRTYHVLKSESDVTDQTRRYTRYELTQRPAWQWDPVTDRVESAFFMLAFPKRVTQTRGISALAPVMQVAGMHEDTQLAKIMQAKAASYYCIIHDIPLALKDEYSGPPGANTDEEVAGCSYGGQEYTANEMIPGSEWYPDHAGESLQAFSPNIPNPEFFQHSNMLLTFIACNLDMPLMLFLLDPTQGNFSAWRGAMDQAKLGFRRAQRMFSEQLHDRVYWFQVRRWLRQSDSLRRAYEADPRAFASHAWTFPGWPYIDPLKDAQADSLLVSRGFKAPSQVVEQRGDDYDRVIEQSVVDTTKRYRLALQASRQLNEEFADVIAETPSERVGWREFLHQGAETVEPSDYLTPIMEQTTDEPADQPA